MKIKIYEYKNCDTCRKALKYLDAENIAYEKLPIVEQPPTLAELKRMLGYLKERGDSVKHLFNTSGEVYREMGIAGRLKAGMPESEALQLLAQNGKLIKRPFVLSAKNGAVGFKPDAWAGIF